jgi:hypothetical protein
MFLRTIPALVLMFLLFACSSVFAAEEDKAISLRYRSAELPEQPVPSAIAGPAGTKPSQLNCPGSFPTDLTILNCRYTNQMRVVQFVTTGFTDEAISLSITGSIFTQLIRSPSEWPETWKYYGYRVGSSYTGSVGRASAEYLVGSMLRDDPRHVRCSDDPILYGQQSTAARPFSCNAGRRIAHALIDSVTVRRSLSGDPNSVGTTKPGKFRHDFGRLPAFSRLVGVYAGAYAQYPWEPRDANTFGAISQRAALSFGSTFLGSFCTEFGSSFFSLFSKKAKH